MSTPRQARSTPPKPPKVRSSLVAWGIYLLCVAGMTTLLFLIPRPLAQLMMPEATPLSIAVPREDLPAFHIIKQTELMSVTQSPAQLPVQAITDTTRISGTISIAPLTAGKAITDGQILAPADLTLLADSVIVAFDSGPELAFGGRLQPGNEVSAWRGSNRLAERLLVLDVQRISPAQENNNTARYVIVVAAPAGVRERLIAAADAQALSFTLSP
jgi:hypothetical protein